MAQARETQAAEEALYTREEEQGIRHHWVMGSMAASLTILILCMLLFVCGVTTYYYLSLRAELTDRAALAVEYLTKYARDDQEAIRLGAESYVADYPDRDRLELQYLDAGGSLLLSSSGRSMDGIPQGSDIPDALEDADRAAWHGRDRDTGETVMAATVPFVAADGSVSGMIRCVSSLRATNVQIVKLSGIAIFVCALVLLLVYLSNRRSLRAMMVPIRQINDTAQLIAEGLYGVHIDPVYPDEIGELCRTLNDMSDAISRSEKLKNDFISSVSHELRTPLTAIGGWGETLLAGGAGESEETRRGLTIITSEAGRLARMVEELLDFSRMESGHLAMRMERIDFTPDIEDVVFMYMDSIRREGIILEYDEADELPEIIGDRNRLRQVFLNLLDNAIKHGGEGKRVRVETYVDAQTLVINVRDFGAGIPADELAHVKERFYKGSSKARGSGIGLAIADEIMKLHGGRLEIQSIMGQGTVATMVLPAIIGDPDMEL